MKRHIKIVAVLYIVLGGLGIVATLIVFGMSGGVPDFSTARDDHQAAMIVLLDGIALLAIVTVSVPSIVASKRASAGSPPFGRTTERVMRFSPCTVLLVPRQQPVPPVGVEPGGLVR